MKANLTDIVVSIVLLLMTAGCSMVREERSSSPIKHQFAQPPRAAAACFARNAEAHSSALVAEVKPADARGNVEVIVRVKNGVLYATVDLRPAGARSEGMISLMVISRRGTAELVSSLVEGC